LYITAYYFTITTITTVGYGDITGTNSYERIICAFLMVFGVCFFAVVSGKILGVLSSIENKENEYADHKSIVDCLSDQINASNFLKT
jgi:hyperpolarization activated cyclic nucleotide-gated potassium channel 2